MAEVQPKDIKTITQSAQTEKPLREFINVNTAENSLLNRGANEDIYQTRELKQKGR